MASARQVTAGNVAAFVRKHADNLIRRFGVHQRAHVDENFLPVGNESIEAFVANENDPRRAGIDAGGMEDGGHVVA